MLVELVSATMEGLRVRDLWGLLPRKTPESMLAAVLTTVKGPPSGLLGLSDQA